MHSIGVYPRESAAECFWSTDMPAVHRNVETARLALFAKTIERASSSDVNPPIGNRRGREALVVQLVHREYFPVAGGLQHRHLPSLADQENLVVRGDGRREVFINSSMQAPLLDHIAGRRIKRDQNPAVVDHIEDA